jgi:ABC-type uncharacterized transport system substrate-binding protein
VRSRVDVLVAVGTPSALAAQRATTTTPIVVLARSLGIAVPAALLLRADRVIEE